MYEPREDSFLLQKYVAQYSRGIVLDMGTGSGIQAVEASHSKKVVKVYAVDVNRFVIRHCRESIINKKIVFLKSNLFSVFKGDKRYRGMKFDTIIFNPPYLPNDPKAPDVALDGGKHGYELVVKFLHDAQFYIKPKTRILLVFSSLTGKDTLDKYLYKQHYKFRELEKENSFFEGIYIYLIENED